MEENNTNEMPVYKLGQILTWEEEANHKGFKFLIEVSAMIKRIVIEKEYMHQKYQSPSFVYTLISTKDASCKWEIEQYHLMRKKLKIEAGYAVDNKINMNLGNNK
jgi:hypothetical protein